MQFRIIGGNYSIFIIPLNEAYVLIY